MFLICNITNSLIKLLLFYNSLLSGALLSGLTPTHSPGFITGTNTCVYACLTHLKGLPMSRYSLVGDLLFNTSLDSSTTQFSYLVLPTQPSLSNFCPTQTTSPTYLPLLFLLNLYPFYSSAYNLLNSSYSLTPTSFNILYSFILLSIKLDYSNLLTTYYTSYYTITFYLY
jgi:hypothetical protein